MDEFIFLNGLMIVSGFIGVAIFVLLFFISAPYGRHVRKGWGPMINSKWGWIIMESPAIIIFVVLFAIGDRRRELVPIIFLFLWLIHYVQRDLIYPFFLRTNKRMPYLILLFGLIFQTSNTYIIARWIFTLSKTSTYSVSWLNIPAIVYTNAWLRDPRFIIGIILFAVGYIINRHSDFVLRKLRKPGEKDYKIPFGGFYKFVSSPNYFGELILWIGFALAIWSWPGFLFAFWTTANLLPRSKSHHQWYKETFPDYPKERKALIPFVF